ncbi:unnamed protein product, partial [Didymodactylos carnosus]
QSEPAGDGISFKAKLFGVEELDESGKDQVCLDAMTRLKAFVKSKKESKQKIRITFTSSGVNLIDESTQMSLGFHEIERISFIIPDPKDKRTFGYIYEEKNDRHQFWAFKTEGAVCAALVVSELNRILEIAFEQSNNNQE